MQGILWCVDSNQSNERIFMNLLKYDLLNAHYIRSTLCRTTVKPLVIKYNDVINNIKLHNITKTIL